MTWQDLPCILGKHRVQAKAWRKIFGDPQGLKFLHHCGQATCREPQHIYLGTTGQNSRDMHRDNPEARVKQAAALRKNNWLNTPEVIARRAATRRGRPNSV